MRGSPTHTHLNHAIRAQRRQKVGGARTSGGTHPSRFCRCSALRGTRSARGEATMRVRGSAHAIGSRAHPQSRCTRRLAVRRATSDDSRSGCRLPAPDQTNRTRLAGGQQQKAPVELEAAAALIHAGLTVTQPLIRRMAGGAGVSPSATLSEARSARRRRPWRCAAMCRAQQHDASRHVPWTQR